MDRNFESVLALAGTAAISVTLAAFAPRDANAESFSAGIATTQHSPSAAATSDVSIERLKTVYLECDRASSVRRLTPGEVMLCSNVYEALKRLAFDGDFDRLLAWARANPSRHFDE